ncbi:AAA family ATPase [Mycolicibacterium sp. CR10]|uniref:AAA family ATPase n=1 Tax=Mycolicibacterium sp. CR10 TaxID=2562314 RepID=UPI0010C046CA|nr:AAA family ATPase [Mycolicibacterium sp. CR10]
MPHDTAEFGERAATLTGLLGTAPLDNTDHEAMGKFVRQLAEAGLSVLFIAPETKVPVDLRTPERRTADDRAAKQGAREAGHRAWQQLKSAAGLALASSDPVLLDRYLTRYLSLYADRHPDGVPVNIAVEVGGSGLVVVDCDTAGQLAAFLADDGADPTAALTVLTPGQRGPDGEWVHSDGGHCWFTVPEGVEMPTATGAMTLGANNGDEDDAARYAVLWDRHYVLIPPSTRREGAYTVTGEVHELPGWLADRITTHVQERAERAARRAERIVEGGDKIARWGAVTPWAEILADAPGWTPTGVVHTCGCETWTAPGPHASPRSAVAHELGCSRGGSDDPCLHIWSDHDIEPFGPMVAEHGPHLTRLRAVAAIHYDNDMGAAMADLSAEYDDLAVDDLPADFGKAAPSGSDHADSDTAKASDPLEAEVAKRLLFLRSDREARRRLALAEADDIELPPVTSLRNLLEQDDPPVRHRIDQVWPDGGARILCAAAAKSGKTTLEGNLVRSLADGDPFLDVFTVNQRAERIVVIDNEMNAGMLRRWLRAQRVENLDAVADVVNMRGRAGLFDLGNDRLRDRWVRRLRDLGCDFLVFDCLKPVLEAMGLDENRETGRFLYPFDALLAEAGIGDALVMHHMGHASERARGDSTLLGWSDGNWKIVKDEDHPAQPRYFSALDVRDAEQPVPEGLLTFDPATRRLTYAGGDRSQSKQSDTTEKRLAEVLTALADAGAEEMNVTQVRTAVGGKKEVTDAALALAATRELVAVRHQGRSKLYRLNPKANDPMFAGRDGTNDGTTAPVVGVIGPFRSPASGPMAG